MGGGYVYYIAMCTVGCVSCPADNRKILDLENNSLNICGGFKIE